MPIPKPSKGESKDDFMGRCMGNKVMVQDYDQKQRAAVCYSSWDRSKKSINESATPDAILSDSRYKGTGAVIVNLILSAYLFPTRVHAQDWAEAHGYNIDKYTHVADAHVFQQLEDSSWATSFSALSVSIGVAVTIACAK